MSEEFEVKDMVYFIEEGCDFSKAILHGIVWQKNYSSVTRGASPSVSSYVVTAVDHMGNFKDFTLMPECVFGTIDGLLSNLKGNYDPKLNLRLLLDESKKYHAGKSEDRFFNSGVLEALQEGYESAVFAEV